MNKNKFKDVSSVLCLNRDKNILRLINLNIQCAEPSSVVGMKDLGKDIIYNSLIEDLVEQQPPFVLKNLHATSKEELFSFLDEIESEKSSVLCVVNLSIGEDVSGFIEELEKLRAKRSSRFVSVIISNIKDVEKSLYKRQKILCRGMFALLPADISDCKILVNDFQRRYEYKVDEELFKQLYYWSQGHLGILKSLYLLCKEEPTLNFSLDSLLSKEPILYRLQAITDELGEEKMKTLCSDSLTFIDRTHFQEFGYLHDGQIFNPLLKEFIIKLKPELDSRKESTDQRLLTLTRQERDVYELLSKNVKSLVSREEVAQAAWKDDWEEKYSDWALDALIHRLRQKIGQIYPESTLETKKGLGFIFIQN